MVRSLTFLVTFGISFMLLLFDISAPTQVSAQTSLNISSGPTVTSLSAHTDSFQDSSGQVGGTATINWTTNLPATSQVEYGVSSSNLNYKSRFDEVPLTKHSIRIQYDTKVSTRYYYRVISQDEVGNQVTSSVQSFTIPSASEWWEVAHANWYKPVDHTPGTSWLDGGDSYRRKFTVNGSIDGAWFSVGRHHQNGPGLKVYVNETLIGSWPYGFSMKVFDLKPHLRQGENVIAITEPNIQIQPFMDGEVVLTNGTNIPLHSNPSLWKRSENPPSGWTSVGFDDSGWPQADLLFDSLFGGYYSWRIVSQLPVSTSENKAASHIAKSMARRDRLNESELLVTERDRNFLSLKDNDEDLSHDLLSQTKELLFDFEPLRDQAVTFQKSGRYAEVETTLSQADVILNQAENLSSLAKLFADVSSEFVNLSNAKDLLNNNSIDAQLANAHSNLNQARNLLSQGSNDSARTALDTANTLLSAANSTLENDWAHPLSKLNDSTYNPFGWLRFHYSSLYGNNDLGDMIALKSVNQALYKPLGWSLQAKDALNFLSPFVVLNTSGNQYDFGSNPTHLAYSTNDQIVIKPVQSGSLYLKSSQGNLSNNWLLFWNESDSKNVILMVMEKNPDEISFTNNRLRISRAGNVGDAVMYAPYADNSSLTSDNATISNWKNGLPQSVTNDMNTWSKIMLATPINYSELYKTSSNSHSEVKIKYNYYEITDDWGTQAIKIAPLPTLLSYARENNYPNITVNHTIKNSNFKTDGGWGSYEFVQGTDTLSFFTPRLDDYTEIKGVNSELSLHREWVTDKLAALGFKSQRGDVKGLLSDRANSFDLQPGWENTLDDVINQTNSRGMRAVLLPWSAVNDPAVLENNPTNQSKFINSWAQIAQRSVGKNVAYDLCNECFFLDVNKYNDLMAQTAQQIRAIDPVNPITIEGFRRFSRNFSGMVHPGTSNTYFQTHVYPPGYGQVYNSIDLYYPGYMMTKFENRYYDRDYFLETSDPSFKDLVRMMISDPRIRIHNGEFGMQVTPPGVREATMKDMVEFQNKFGMAQHYFTATGWTMFDLFAGLNEGYQEDTATIDVLLGNQPQPPPSPTPKPIDQDGDGDTDIIDVFLSLIQFPQFSVLDFNQLITNL